MRAPCFWRARLWGTARSGKLRPQRRAQQGKVMSGHSSHGEKPAGEESWQGDGPRGLIPEKRICLAILGMHRSGTSALTRVLSILGAKLPATLNVAHGGSDTNWESSVLIGYDDALLAELDSTWQDWSALNWTRIPMRRRSEIKAEIAELVDAEFGQAAAFLVKEPRICRFAPLFFDALESSDIEVRCLLPIRSPLEVVESLVRRDGLARGQAALLWLRHVLDAEAATRSRPRVITGYDSLLSDWTAVVTQIANQLSLKWKYAPGDVAGIVDNFLSAERRHYTSTLEDVLLDPLLRTWMGEVYSALLVLERNPKSESALATLDQIRETFNGAAPILQRLLKDSSEGHAAELTMLRQTLEQERADTEQRLIAEAAAERAAAEAELRGRNDALSRLLTDAQAALAHEQSGSASLARELHQQRAKLDEALAALRLAGEELSAAHLRLRTKEEELSAANTDIGRRAKVMAETASELAVERYKASERGAELARSVAERDALQADAASRERALEAAAAEIKRRDAKLNASEAGAREQEARLRSTYSELRAAREQLESAASDIERLRHDVAARDMHLHAMGSSTSWKITRPIRGAKKLLTDPEFRRRLTARFFGGGAVQPLRRWTLPWAQHVLNRLMIDRGYRANAFTKASRVIRGEHGEIARAEAPAPVRIAGEPPRRVLEPYEAWLAVNKLTDADRHDLREALALREGRTPKLSAIMPVYNSDERLLREVVDCVRGQIYENWELCLVDDCSPAGHVRPLLKELARLDKRIKVKHRPVNGGIAECTNAAVEMADGEVVVFIDHDDLVTEDCFAELALYYADHADADIVYSDDDKVDMAGARSAPQFKPDYAPTLLLSFMYMGHVFSVRRSLFLELGGFRKAFDGSQDYDFALRACERARHVGHIPKILYSWRIAPGSTAASADAKPASFEAGCRAVEEALARRNMSGKAHHPDWARAAKCGIFSIEFPDTGPSVTLIIPTRDKLDLLRPCIESLSKTTYDNMQIMVVDNDSQEPATHAYLTEIAKRPNVRVERISNNGAPFSYARINNEAVRRAATEFVLLLNNDTEVRAPRWLSQMMGYAQMAGVGAVGAKLLFGDGTIQHAGIVHGMYDGMAGPAFRNRDCHDWGYLGFLKVAREYSAVTAACLLVRKQLYQDLGGLDERRFNVAYNDVDFCYRLVDRGLSCVYCAEAELFHYEGKSRGHRDNPREIAAFRARYKGRADRYYNPNLSLEDEHFRIRGARPSRRARRPTRAVMVSHNLEHEGAPNSMMELVAGLKRRGLVDPIVLSPMDGPLRAHYEAAGIPVQIIRNPIADIHDEATFLSSMDAFGRWLRRFGAEVVYGNTLQTFWALTGARAAGLPSIWNPRESESSEHYFDYLAPELRSHAFGAFASAYAVVFVAEATRRNWRALDTRHNFRVVRNGINLERLSARAGGWRRENARAHLGLFPNEVCVTLVGTVCDRKNQIDLVSALDHLAPSIFEHTRFQIVGDRAGPYSEALRTAAASLPPSRQARLSIVDETGDPYLYFRSADIALCTSRIESYPRVILEAMACGLPIITTPVFGIAEQVREEVNALFYQPGDAAQLARQIERLTMDQELRARMSDNSPLVLQCLTQFDEMIEAYATVFREAANSPSSAAL